MSAATSGILTDSTDLPPEGDYLDEDGFPDVEKVTEAAKALVEAKPHLGDKRPSQPVEQGPRSESAHVNLAGMVRQLAG